MPAAVATLMDRTVAAVSVDQGADSAVDSVADLVDRGADSADQAEDSVDRLVSEGALGEVAVTEDAANCLPTPATSINSSSTVAVTLRTSVAGESLTISLSGMFSFFMYARKRATEKHLTKRMLLRRDIILTCFFFLSPVCMCMCVCCFSVCFLSLTFITLG